MSLSDNQQKLGEITRWLKAADILKEVEEQEKTLLGIAKVVISEKIMDKDTIIYRLAMTVYHSKTITQVSLIKSLEDPALLLLNLIENKETKATMLGLNKQYRAVPSSELARSLISFLIGAYIYYRAEQSIGEVPSAS